MKIIQIAKQIAETAHSGQTDKGGQPYINHSVAVSELVSTDEEKATALLHDVIEDTAITLQELLDFGIPEPVVMAVDCLTKRKGETYEDYLTRVKSNPIARVVKVADMTHNSDILRIPNPSEKDYERIAKYQRSIEQLVNQKPQE